MSDEPRHAPWALPPGYYWGNMGLNGGERRCPECGSLTREVDQVEGLPIHACPKKCGIETPAKESAR